MRSPAKREAKLPGVQAREDAAKALRLGGEGLTHGVGYGPMLAIERLVQAIVEEPADPVDILSPDRAFLCGKEARAPKAAVLLEEIPRTRVACGCEDLAGICLDPDLARPSGSSP